MGFSVLPLRIFISSAQGEFAGERAALRDYVHDDPLIRRFFEVFLFEDVPASDQRPDQLYLDEVERCDIYVGLFGADYGSEDGEGVSPTEREFDQATAVGAHRLVFLKAVDGERHPKMQALVRKAEAGLIRKRSDARTGRTLYQRESTNRLPTQPNPAPCKRGFRQVEKAISKGCK